VAVLPLALLLGCIVFLWSKQLFGREAGLGALFLYSFEPNILAHSGLVTTDVAAACFIFATIYGFYRFVRRMSLTNLVLAGFALGIPHPSWGRGGDERPGIRDNLVGLSVPP
jgi:4-amino-4-deoxy-L-arabinose transferase-like glycosyltransferase